MIYKSCRFLQLTVYSLLNYIFYFVFYCLSAPHSISPSDTDRHVHRHNRPPRTHNTSTYTEQKNSMYLTENTLHLGLRKGFTT